MHLALGSSSLATNAVTFKMTTYRGLLLTSRFFPKLVAFVVEKMPVD